MFTAKLFFVRSERVLPPENSVEWNYMFTILPKLLFGNVLLSIFIIIMHHSKLMRNQVSIFSACNHVILMMKLVAFQGGYPRNLFALIPVSGFLEIRLK
jgi:hypothetical protein